MEEYKNEEIRLLADGLLRTLGKERAVSIQDESMAAYEKGFSGAALFRITCVLSGGERVHLICKKAELRERMAMVLLTGQGHASTPAAYSEDCISNLPKWMVQQDLGKRVPAPKNNPAWMQRVALALAKIHGKNMRRGEEMPWLPRADADYWQKIVKQISISHFEKAVCEDEKFARQFEATLPKLQAAGRRFAADMTALSEESPFMTLTHGDIQRIDGSHVYNVEGRPYIIDFGFCRYAPFFIDLVDYFSLEEALFYRQALADQGVHMPPRDFEARFRAAAKYPGFIYMFPGIMQWKRGDENGLVNCIQRILQHAE